MRLPESYPEVISAAQIPQCDDDAAYRNLILWRKSIDLVVGISSQSCDGACVLNPDAANGFFLFEGQNENSPLGPGAFYQRIVH